MVYIHTAKILLSSYLKDRQQRAIIGDKKGEWQHVSKGAAQGSIMGPFCFNVFTNDLLNTFDDKVEIYNYADDNTLISTGYNYEDVKHELFTVQRSQSHIMV